MRVYMFSKLFISAIVLSVCASGYLSMSASTSHASPAAAFAVLKTYSKYLEKKDLRDRLKNIQKDLSEIKSDLNLMINSHLKSAITALDDAQHMVSEAEKIESIRSARVFLTQAINMEKEPQRKALAMYMLGHVYLLLNERHNAKRKFESVMRFQFGEEKGLWKKKTVYNPEITKLKVDASGILCSFREKATAIKENWCALHIGYRGAKSINLKDLEECLASEDTRSCERVGYRLLKTYIDKNRVSNTQESLTMIDPFSEGHSGLVSLSKDFIFKSCNPKDAAKLPSIDDYHGCYWRAQALLHQREYDQVLDHHRFLCKAWLGATEAKASDDWVEAVTSEAMSACKALYKEPLWSRLTRDDKAQYVRALCLQGDLVACAQLLRDTHLYHKSLPTGVSSFLARQCLVKDREELCALINDTIKPELAPMRITFRELLIGLNAEGKRWDMKGDSNPEVLLRVKLGGQLIYHQRLNIKSINTDASGHPQSYEMTLAPALSLPVYLEFAKNSELEVILTDLDAYDHDLISAQTFSYQEFKSYSSKFGQVLKLSMSLDPLQPARK